MGFHQKPRGTMSFRACLASGGVRLPEVDDSKLDQFYVDMGKKIRAARDNAEMSQSKLARIIGFNRSSVANLEAGRQRVALHLFILIAEALHVEFTTLVPDVHFLGAGTTAIGHVNEHLAGMTGKTQDFVLGTVALVSGEQAGES